MLDKLKTVLSTIFESDRESIGIIKQNIGEDAAENYPAPPEDIEGLSERILEDDNVEIIDAYTCEEDEIYENKRIKRGSNILFFKFKDVKIRRRKIYRFGDYYVKLFHSGLNKWDFFVLTKSRIMLGEVFTDIFYPAQHPHIQSGRPCLSQFETPIRASITNYNITGFMWNFKLYLNKWNYHSPYHEPESFEYLSLIKWKPFHLMNAIDLGYSSSTYDYLKAINYDKSNDYEDVYEIKPMTFPSARLKSYIPEPISRILKESSYWKNLDGDYMFNDNRPNYCNKTLTYNLDFLMRDNFNFEHRHDSLILVLSLNEILVRKGIERNKQSTPTWPTVYDNLITEMKLFKGSLAFYKDMPYKDADFEDIWKSDYYIYYFHHEIKEDNDIRVKYDSLTAGIVELEYLRRDCLDANSNDRITYKQKQELWMELFKIARFPYQEESQETIGDLIKTANSLPIISKEDNIVMKVVEIENLYREVRPALEQELKNRKIEHYKEELRRLTQNENTTKIDSINL